MASRRRWIVLAAALVASLAMLFAACGGGDDDEDESDEPTETPAAAETPSGGDDGDNGDDDGDDGDDGAGGSGGDSGEFTDLLDKFAESTFTANYDVTGITTEDLGFEDAVFTMYKEGTDRLRFDIAGVLEGEDVAIFFIENGADSGFCVQGDVGLPVEGDGACFQGDQFGDQFGSISDNFDELQSTDFEVLDESEREIAGQDAQCFKIRDTADATETDVCMSEDGGLLYFADQEGTSFEATSFSDEVSDGDFDLPFEVQEIPGF